MCVDCQAGTTSDVTMEKSPIGTETETPASPPQKEKNQAVCVSYSGTHSASMKLKKDSILSRLDFDTAYCLFSVRNAHMLAAYFRLLDCHDNNTLNDIQFCNFMCHATDLRRDEAMSTFQMLDWDASGEIDFEQFYMIVCILLCNEFHVEKTFIFRHSWRVFKLLDTDGSGEISSAEFQASGFLFNLTKRAVTELFEEFDVSRDANLNYKEFKMFTMACIDMQQEARDESQLQAVDEESSRDLAAVVVEP